MWGFFIVRGLSRGESSSWALFKNKNTKGSVGGDLQVLTDFSPSLQPGCWKSPESGIKKKSGGKMFRYRACAQSLRGMPGSEGRCRWSSLKERINLSTWTRRKYGRHSGLPPPASATKLNMFITPALSGDGDVCFLWWKPDENVWGSLGIDVHQHQLMCRLCFIEHWWCI